MLSAKPPFTQDQEMVIDPLSNQVRVCANQEVEALLYFQPSDANHDRLREDRPRPLG